MKSFELNGTVATTVQVSDHDMGWAIHLRAYQMVGAFDDAGMDWLTDGKGNTYVGTEDWLVSSDPKVAALVDASNVLRGHGIMRIEVKAQEVA